ncbi:helix-turn-helix domain-containing protein [Streptomyces sp. NPDC048182]|uniref:helix-turn-helix domain-containing protein n=1 Tax=Streptomyces sp. NPDC048182 TaxID=3365507 RepID=UPI00371A91B1
MPTPPSAGAQEAAVAPPTPPVPLAALLAREDLALRPVVPPADPDLVIHGAHTSEMADPYPYLLGGELLLTAGVHVPAGAGAGYFDAYVSRIVAAGGAALGFGVAPVFDTVPEALAEACATHGLPLLEVPPRTTFSGVARAVWQLMARARLAELRRVSEAQRQLAAAAARPDPVPSVLHRLAVRLEGRAVLYGPDGAELAAAGREPAEGVRGALAELARLVTARASTTATDTAAGTHLAAYALGAGQALTLGVATPHREPGDHTIASVAAVLLSLLTGESRTGTGAARSAALVRVLLGARPAEVAPLLDPADGDRWHVVHGVPSGTRPVDPVAASSLGTALGSPLVDVSEGVVRVLVPAPPPTAPRPSRAAGTDLADVPERPTGSGTSGATDRPDRPDRTGVTAEPDRPGCPGPTDGSKPPAGPDAAPGPNRPDGSNAPGKPDQPDQAVWTDQPGTVTASGGPGPHGGADSPRVPGPNRPGASDAPGRLGQSTGAEPPHETDLAPGPDRPSGPEASDRPSRPGGSGPHSPRAPGPAPGPNPPGEPEASDRPNRPNRPAGPSRSPGPDQPATVTPPGGTGPRDEADSPRAPGPNRPGAPGAPGRPRRTDRPSRPGTVAGPHAAAESAGAAQPPGGDGLSGWVLGVSAPVSPADWPEADAQAGRALARARANRVPVVRHGGRGGLAGLVPEGDAEAYARTLLAPLADAPALTETLRAWLSLHGSWDRTAVALGIHRNTVRQRVARCAALLAADLDDADVRMELWFALRRM